MSHNTSPNELTLSERLARLAEIPDDPPKFNFSQSIYLQRLRRLPARTTTYRDSGPSYHPSQRDLAKDAHQQPVTAELVKLVFGQFGEIPVFDREFTELIDEEIVAYRALTGVRPYKELRKNIGRNIPPAALVRKALIALDDELSSFSTIYEAQLQDAELFSLYVVERAALNQGDNLPDA